MLCLDQLQPGTVVIKERVSFCGFLIFSVKKKPKTKFSRVKRNCIVQISYAKRALIVCQG